MKQIFLIIGILLLSLWYSGIHHEQYVKRDNETILKRKKIIDLHEKGIIGKPDFSKEYFSKQNVAYFKKRSYIPFIYNKDTVMNSNKKYYKKNR